MQLPLYQLKSHLKQSLQPCYLLHGDEWLLAEEAQISIENAAKNQGFSNKKTVYIQQESDWNLLKATTGSFDLFTTKQIFLIRCLSGNITKVAQHIIEEHLNNKQLAHQLWIILTPKLKKSAQSKSWYQSILKQGIIIPIYELKGVALQKWVKCKLDAAKLKVANQDVITQLVAMTEGNLLATDQAVQKLKLLFPTQPLTLENIHAAIQPNAHFNLFQLIDELLKGQTQKALNILAYLHEINHPPLLILWAIARQLRELITLSKQLSCGISMQRLLQSQWASRRTFLQSALSRLSLQDLEQLLLFCSKIDKMLKNITLTDAWKALDVLVVRFNYPKFLKR